jgi:hypothetical protein
VLLIAGAVVMTPVFGCSEEQHAATTVRPTSENCAFRDELSTISVGTADVWECKPGSEPPKEAYEFGCGEIETSAVIGGAPDPDLTYWSCLD